MSVLERHLQPLQPQIGVIAAAVGTTVLVAAAMSFDGSFIRFAIALVLLVDLVIVSVRYPKTAIVLAIMLSLVIPLGRRLFIPLTGLTTFDPLLLITPGFAVFMVCRLFLIEGRRISTDLLSTLILVVLGITVLQVVNPAGGGVIAGLTGLLYVSVPLLWFFIGREYGSKIVLERLLIAVLVAAVAIALYGLYQALVAFPPWDRQWADAVSAQQYVALYVGTTLRPWGTLSSSAEYALLLGIGLVVSVALLVRGRWGGTLPILLLCWALILASTRGTVVLALLAIAAIVFVRTPKAWMRLLVVVLSIGGIVGAQRALSASISPTSLAGSNSLLTHQLAGLANPTDPTQSTAGLHLQLIADAFKNSLAHPIGLGTAATNIAGTKTATGPGSSEVDLPDALNNLGLAGGLAYAAVIVVAFARCGRACLKRPGLGTYAVVGIMALCLGQWLNGGLYAVSALIWLVIGSSNRILLDAEHGDEVLTRVPPRPFQPEVLPALNPR